MKIAIDCIHYPISSRISSHRSSWARYWKWYLELHWKEENTTVDILGRGDEDKWEDYDAVYFYQGMEWNGKLNIPGGLQPWHYERLKAYAKLSTSEKVKNQEVFLYSIEVDMPDYQTLLFDRHIEAKYLKDVHKAVHTVSMDNKHDKSKKIVLGDSHSLSVMDSKRKKFTYVYRTDFKTLNGALLKGLRHVQNIDWSMVKEATFFFGMIDLRHHVMRHGGFTSIDDLMERYEVQLKEISDSGIDVELVEMYPMTKNSRKLPKSGFYDGEPFSGTIEERIACVDYMNDRLENMCHRNGWGFYKHPELFHDDDHTVDEFFMEKPRSVHMSAEFYRFDLEKGKTRAW